MIRRLIYAVLNRLIAVLEAVVDDKRDRGVGREYWLIAPTPPEDAVTKAYVDKETVRDGLGNELMSWEIDEPGGETP